MASLINTGDQDWIVTTPSGLFDASPGAMTLMYYVVLYEEEYPTVLEGSEIQWQYADKGNIESTFISIRKKAKAEDIIVIYLSGHGVARNGRDRTQFYYLHPGRSE